MKKKMFSKYNMYRNQKIAASASMVLLRFWKVQDIRAQEKKN